MYNIYDVSGVDFTFPFRVFEWRPNFHEKRIYSTDQEIYVAFMIII